MGWVFSRQPPCNSQQRTHAAMRMPPPLPPGPPTLPIMGSLPLIGMGKAAGLGPPPHERMSELAAQYGSVMTLSFGREPWVVLSSPQAVHEAFVERASDFSGRPMVASMAISSGNGQGFAQPTLTPELKRLRRAAFGSFFDKARVAQAQVALHEEAECLADHLVSVTAATGSGVELRGPLRRCVTNMVLRYAFSARVPFTSEGTGSRGRSSSDTYAELVDVADEIWRDLCSTSTFAADLMAPPPVAGTTSAPASSLLRSAYYAPLAARVKKRDTLLLSIVAQRRRLGIKPPTDPSADMLDALLCAELSDSEVLYTLVDLFVAGVNTVASSLEWYLLLLAKEPLVQERARADTTKAHATATAQGRAGYAQGVVREVLRAKPPLLLPRRAVVDSTVCGYAVPKGRVVLANNHALTQSDEYWHEPQCFRPERWLQEEANLGGSGVAACKYIPYSIGARACPGRQLAEAEMETATRTLLSRCRWRRVAPIDLREEYSLTLVPKMAQALRFERL